MFAPQRKIKRPSLAALVTELKSAGWQFAYRSARRDFYLNPITNEAATVEQLATGRAVALIGVRS